MWADFSADPRNLEQAAKPAQLGLPGTNLSQSHSWFYSLKLPVRRARALPTSMVGVSA